MLCGHETVYNLTLHPQRCHLYLETRRKTIEEKMTSMSFQLCVSRYFQNRRDYSSFRVQIKPAGLLGSATDATEWSPTYTSVRDLHQTHKLSPRMRFATRLRTHAQMQMHTQTIIHGLPGASSRLFRRDLAKL